MALQGAQKRITPLSAPLRHSMGVLPGFLIRSLILNIDSKELAHLHLHRSPDLGQ